MFSDLGPGLRPSLTNYGSQQYHSFEFQLSEIWFGGYHENGAVLGLFYDNDAWDYSNKYVGSTHHGTDSGLCMVEVGDEFQRVKNHVGVFVVHHSNQLYAAHRELGSPC